MNSHSASPTNQNTGVQDPTWSSITRAIGKAYYLTGTVAASCGTLHMGATFLHYGTRATLVKPIGIGCFLLGLGMRALGNTAINQNPPPRRQGPEQPISP